MTQCFNLAFDSVKFGEQVQYVDEGIAQWGLWSSESRVAGRLSFCRRSGVKFWGGFIGTSSPDWKKGGSWGITEFKLQKIIFKI